MSNKFNIKNCALLFGSFIAGMLSVSIANIFGGYYCSVLAIVAVLSTLYVFDSMDNNNLKENKINIILLGVLVLCEAVFFVANDIVGYAVYKKSSMGFFDMFVMGSQLFSVGVIAYTMISIVLSFFTKDSIELVDDISTPSIHEEETKKEEVTFEQKEVKEEKKEEYIKRIAQNTVRKEAPFMEEEI